MSNLKNYKVLKMLISNAKLELKGDAIVAMASSISWFDKLEGLMVELDEKEKIEPKIEPVSKPIKNGKANANK